MGMAEIAEAQRTYHLRHNPANPQPPTRDRFVLSNGHGSLLLYTLLHLTGYVSHEGCQALPPAALQDPRAPRSSATLPAWSNHPWAWPTPSPPRARREASGLRVQPSRVEIVDHRTYALRRRLSDGGYLGLRPARWPVTPPGQAGLPLRRISIDGHVEGWFTHDTPQAPRGAYGWHVIPDVNGHDPEAIQAAIVLVKAETRRLSGICCWTMIGTGRAYQGGHPRVASAPLAGGDRRHPPGDRLPLRALRFGEVYAAWDARARGAELEAEWNARFARYRSAYPTEAAGFQRRIRRASGGPSVPPRMRRSNSAASVG